MTRQGSLFSFFGVSSPPRRLCFGPRDEANGIRHTGRVSLRRLTSAWRNGGASRSLWFLCFALCVWLFGATAAAQSDTVRLGATSTEPLPPPSHERAPHQQAPSDAPRLPDSHVQIPPPPASFNTYDGGWIEFAYPPGVRERVQPLITQADDARAELKARLGQAVMDSIKVYVARTPGEMATLAPANAPFPKYAAGVAYPQLGLILLTITGHDPTGPHNLQEIFRHELAHLALHDAVAERPVPRWFNEGFAVFASGESSYVRMQTLWRATIADRLPSLKQLERTFPADADTASVAYAQASDVVRFLVRQQDRHRFTGMIERIRKGQPFEAAVQDAYGTDLANLEYEWREDVARRYTFWPVFFGGSAIWFVALGLFVWGWRRKRKQSRETLARWAREEAVEEERRMQREIEDNARVHIVLARGSSRPPPMPPPGADPEVPKVEHDGRWHTLH